jgi:hypothetical protein
VSEPERPPPEVRGKTTRRAYLLGGLLLVALTALAVVLTQCEKSTPAKKDPSSSGALPAPRTDVPPADPPR